MEPRKKDDWRSLRACDSGGHTEALLWSGVDVCPGSESMAKRGWGLPGSWESLLSPRTNRRKRVRPTQQDPGSSVRSRRKGSEPDEHTEVSEIENKDQEKGRGSLSISIVVLRVSIFDGDYFMKNDVKWKAFFSVFSVRILAKCRMWAIAGWRLRHERSLWPHLCASRRIVAYEDYVPGTPRCYR
jgi:hypothetical protein